MSLPPGFLDELRDRLSLSQVVGRKVTWDMRKSNQGKGDWWAPCPFHHEKTASFHVDDRKGFYYCFGCHEKGDAIGFVMAAENMSFIEAVKDLAAEAGMQMPQSDPRAQQQADRRATLHEVMELAVKWGRLQLRASGAAAARDYLVGRGLDGAACDRWEIGFAPEHGGLFRALRDKGVPEADIIAAGIAAESDRGGSPYDRFRHRILFPIRDGRGRAIAFGGRAMDPNARAKYLNSPETPLFDKGRSLYNHKNARAAAGKGQPLIVAEGYMDVIALAEAGFEGAVAPLGTAITEGQLELMWRIAPEPVIALDGDQAGLRAAMRLIDVALPMLAAGRSLRFCLMPAGRDPDDLIKAEGPGAMQAALDGAKPLIELLWQRETAGQVLDSPERRAALDKRLREVIGKIGDPDLREHYKAEIRERRRALFGGGRADGGKPRGGQGGYGGGFGGGFGGGGRGNFRPGQGGARWQPPAQPQPTTRASLIAGSDDEALLRMREALILALFCRHPGLLDRFEDQFERLSFDDPGHADLAATLLRAAVLPPEARAAAIGDAPLEKLPALRHLSVVPALRSDDQELAADCLREELARLAAHRSARREIQEALAEAAQAEDEALTWRLSRAAEALARQGTGQAEDRTEYEVAPNGVRMNRSEKSALDGLLERINAESRKG